jgi:hypothetical protein
MHEAKEVFWEQIALAIPVVFAVLLPLALAWASNKLRNVGSDAAQHVERIKRSGQRMTPTEQMAAAVKYVRGTDGTFTSIVPEALIRARVEDVVSSYHALDAAKSDPPRRHGDSGEHAIGLPPRSKTGFSGAHAIDLPPDLARPSGAPSGLDMDVVDRDADTQPIEPLPRKP